MSSKLLNILVIKDMSLGNHLNDIHHFLITLDTTSITMSTMNWVISVKMDNYTSTNIIVTLVNLDKP
jgi:hypothetical protein